MCSFFVLPLFWHWGILFYFNFLIVKETHVHVEDVGNINNKKKLSTYHTLRVLLLFIHVHTLPWLNQGNVIGGTF